MSFESNEEVTIQTNLIRTPLARIVLSNEYNIISKQNFMGIWFRDGIELETDHDKQLEKCLNQLFNYWKVFINPVEFISYISNNKITKVYLILTSLSLNESILNIIDNRIDFVSIYIPSFINICLRWTCNDRIFNDLQEFSENILKNESQNEIITDKYTEQLPIMHVFNSKLNETSIKNLDVESNKFIWLQIYIEILLLMKHTPKAKDEMLNVCRTNYLNDNIELIKINQFETEYSSHSPIWHYTCDSFLFRLINKAFGTENIDHIYPYRIFITDLHKALKTLYVKNENTLLLYRGKKLPLNVLQKLYDSKTKFIVMNGFLSTTTDENVARAYAGTGEERKDYKSVLFELTVVNYRIKPYADITGISQFPQEGEILFSFGTIWIVNDIIYESTTQFYHIKLSPAKYDDLRSITSLHHLMNELMWYNRDCNLLTLGNFILDSVQYKTAENYYQRMLDELLSSTIVDDKLKGILYNNMAVCRYEQNDYNIALEYYNKYTTLLESNDDSYATDDHLYKSYIEKHKNKLKQQMILKLLLLNKNCSSKSKIIIYHNMAYTYQLDEKYDKALELYCKIIENNKLNECSELSATYNNVGCIYFVQGQYQKAFDMYQEAINIGKNFLSENHPWLDDYRANMTIVCRCDKELLIKT